MTVKDISVKNRTYCFFDDIINIKDFDSNNIKIDELLLQSHITHFYTIFF